MKKPAAGKGTVGPVTPATFDRFDEYDSRPDTPDDKVAPDVAELSAMIGKSLGEGRGGK